MHNVNSHVSDLKADKISDLQQVFIKQKECYEHDSYSSYLQRTKTLKALYKLLIAKQDSICEAINKDFGNRPVHETKVLEIFPCLELIKYNLKYLKSWMKRRRHKVSKWFLPSRCYVIPQPKGIVGIISPWNYPLLLTIAPLVAALAAGNRVMIKTSEYTPSFSAILDAMLAEIFLPTKVAVITGDHTIGAAFSSLCFDHLFFTGSTNVGKKVYQAASSNLVPVTLELGGKSPVILLEDEICLEYLTKIWLGKMINAGQTCIAPDYVWTQQGTGNKILEYTKQVWSERFGNLDDDIYCSIINKNNYLRIIELVEDAVSKGAQFEPAVTPWHSEQNGIYKIAPGLLLNTNHTMDIMQEEIFGPILPIMEYDGFDSILKIFKIVPRPLVIYLFTQDKSVQQAFEKGSISGALTINNTLVHAAQESLPFGGIGDSGIGSYRGKYGFETFSMLKPVYKQSRLDVFTKFYPPIKTWQKKLLDIMLK